MEPIQTFLILLGIVCFLWVLWKLFGRKEERRREFTDSEKKEILNRQNYCCATCDNKDYDIFEFHHKKLFSEGGETCVENGVALCRNCHAKITYREGKE